jgi:flagella basal body P-ring formation protein FlgA
MMEDANLKKISPRCVLVIFLVLPLAIFIIAGAPDSVAAEITTIRLLEKVEINAAKISLGAIAQIDGGNQHLIQRLKQIDIGKAPLPSRSRVIAIDYIRLRLKQNGFSLENFDLQGSSGVKITRSFIEVDRQKIEKILSHYLRTTVLKNNTIARIKDFRVPGRIILPKGHITYQVMAPRNTKYLGKIPLAVHFNVDGQFQKKVWTSATIEMFVDVVVSAKPLRKHMTITEDVIELRQMDLAHLPANVITDPQAVLGKRTRSTISAKTVLRTDLIELPPLVKRGDIVLIVAESKGLRITALGKAKRKGRLGERIPVENFDSKKILNAKVLDAKTVRIEF